MVVAIPTSDSNNTLVSLDHRECYREQQAWEPLPSATTERDSSPLLLPTNLELSNSDQQCLYLPPKESCSPYELDRYLQQSIPKSRIYEEPTFQFTPSTQEQVFYVHQGEVAHALPTQCDILMSDRATTCHIMILRSTCNSTATRATTPMTSLTHIDGTHTGYAQSIREMIQAHKIHHSNTTTTTRSCTNEDDDAEIIQMTIHVLGGFDTTSSQELSHWLLYLLAGIAADEEESFGSTGTTTTTRRVRMFLETCSISSLNDTGRGIPKGRGLGINVHTGKVFLARAIQAGSSNTATNATTASPPTTTTIPVLPLRNARIWSSGPKRLHLIHTTTSSQITLYPFVYKTKTSQRQQRRRQRRSSSSSSCYAHNLLQLSDHQLLEQTSTSPHAEISTEFVPLIRSTLQLLRDVSPQELFGCDLNQPIKFERCLGTYNHWCLVD